jgi:dethiobiotin synthetase
MTRRFVVTGTDTGVGKTVFAAALVRALGGVYYKPVQAGLDTPTDSETVRDLAEMPAADVLPEAYRLTTPASPHLAAEWDGVTLAPSDLAPPPTNRPLIVEGAGGLCVPLTRRTLYIDVFAAWRLPVILCARTQLGTINHTLLSLEALKQRGIPVHGIAFIGPAEPPVEQSITDFAQVPRLGRLGPVDPLTPDALATAFAEGFNPDDFA